MCLRVPSSSAGCPGLYSSHHGVPVGAWAAPATRKEKYLCCNAGERWQRRWYNEDQAGRGRSAVAQMEPVALYAQWLSATVRRYNNLSSAPALTSAQSGVAHDTAS